MAKSLRKKETDRLWRLRNRDRWAAYDRRSRLRNRYGISEQFFVRAKELQDFKCAICHETFGNRVEIDHSHATGKFRGLLCQRCNLGLGQFRDSVAVLQNAAAYLETR